MTAMGEPNSEPMTNEMRILRIKAESIERTRSMLSMCEESEMVGIQTLVMLNDQGEKLDHVEKNLHDIKHSMNQAKYNLSRLKNCCDFGIIDFFRRLFSAKNFEDVPILSEVIVTKDDEIKGKQRLPIFRIDDPHVEHGPVVQPTGDDEEDEIEQNMVDISCMVSNLKNMAVDIGSEIESQNRQLERIQEEMDEDQEKIEQANKLARELLSKD